jgi:hypothetical protein
MPATKSSTKKASPKSATAKKTSARKAAAPKAKTGARRGDHILVDSPQVGSPPREGEVLKVIRGEVSVSYRVKWTDGHETLIAPTAGSVTIVRA